jgi:hypothetical protein
MPILFVFAIPFAVAFADTGKSMTIQDQIIEQINSLLHEKPNFSLDFSKKQITEYSMIGAIAIVVVIVIASSARSKTRPKTN